jgi:hypothetical protein
VPADQHHRADLVLVRPVTVRAATSSGRRWPDGLVGLAVLTAVAAVAGAAFTVLEGRASPPARAATSAPLLARLDAAFAGEPATAWGEGAQLRARQVLGRLATPGSTLASIACRATLCRIEASHRDLEAYNTFSMAVIRSRRKEGLWNGWVTSRVRTRSASSVTTVTFLTREGFPRPDAEPEPGGQGTPSK